VDNNEKILSMIGLCKRAGKLVTGEQKVLENIKKKTSSLVIIATDASNGTLKRITDKCISYKRDYIIYSDRFTLGTYTKKEYAVTVSVNDINFATRIKELYSKDSLE